MHGFSLLRKPQRCSSPSTQHLFRTARFFLRTRRALAVFKQYIEKRMKFPFFSNARTVSDPDTRGAMRLYARMLRLCNGA